MRKISYTYSQLSTQSVLEFLSDFYEIGEVCGCKYYVLGLHDNYFVETESRKYILRIYRNDWRSPDEINFELGFLDYLKKQGSLISYPLLTIEDQLYFQFSAPEGTRFATLFYYAEGDSPGNSISPSQSELLGHTVATIHKFSNSFECKEYRKVLDIPYLVDGSVLAIESFLSKEQLHYILRVRDIIESHMPDLPKEEGVWGACHGDVNPTNFHINSESQITLFDFDQCGYGYRAFEIAKFKSSIYPIENKEEVESHFLQGYQSVRQLSGNEIKAIPYLEIISHIWVMAIHAYNVNRIGYKYLEKPFWDRRISVIKKLEERLA